MRFSVNSDAFRRAVAIAAAGTDVDPGDQAGDDDPAGTCPRALNGETFCDAAACQHWHQQEDQAAPRPSAAAETAARKAKRRKE